MIEGTTVVTSDAIPAGHKVALWDIAPGEMVERYGQAIGRAKVPIAAGQHIHTHNLAFEELDSRVRVSRGRSADARARGPQSRTFWVTSREDGRVGTRNYIAVVAASNCAAHTAERSRGVTKASAAAERGWRGGVSARRRMRARDGSGRGPAAADARRRAGASQRFGRGDPGAWAAR